MQGKSAYALFLEQGTGKTRIVLEEAATLWREGKIELLLVAAWPKGVHEAWARYQIPEHIGDIQYEAIVWQARVTKRDLVRLEQLARTEKSKRPLVIVLMNIEAFSTKKGTQFADRLLAQYETYFVVDESQTISSARAQRTKNVLKLGKLAKYRRIMTGTPMENPLDLFTQMQFLDPKILGFSNIISYRNYYAVVIQQKRNNRAIRRKDGKLVTLRPTYPVIVSYRHLDKLQKAIEPYSYRVLKKDCMDLPEKVYVRRIVELSEEQRAAYEAMRAELRAELVNKDGTWREVSATIALTKLTKLRQIIGGAVYDDEAVLHAFKDVPRIERLVETTHECAKDAKVIIFGEYTAELERVAAALIEEHGAEAVLHYYGKALGDKKGRVESIDRFKNDAAARFFVAQTRSGGAGLDFPEASVVMFYSNPLSLRRRLQAEDRAHRKGQENKVTYYDFEAKDTNDKIIIDNLVKKRRLYNAIFNDPVGEWL